MGGFEELQTFIHTWCVAISSMCYCYFISTHIPKGLPRLFSLLPVISLFLFLPLSLSTVHLLGPTVFYLVWLANFKLLLFAFGRGPLLSTPPLPLSIFISIALLPINPKRPSPFSSPNSSSVRLAVKALILAVVVGAYRYKEILHWNLILVLYCVHVYLALELVLAITAFFVRVFLGFGFEIEPQFNEPYLATSLQDFWGRRWNLMVTTILRPTVYDPVREISTPVLGKQWALFSATFATFLVSGLMHEVMYYYLTRVGPTWEVTLFFVLHGVCTGLEVASKKAVNGRLRLHRAVSGPLTVVFVAVTGVWLFLPQLLRNGVVVKTINEYYVLVNFIRSKLE